MDETRPGTLSRRRLLQGGGAIAVAAFGPLGCGGGRRIALPLGQLPPGASSYLSDAELNTLNAVVDRFVPEDSDPGAAAAGCADAINALLSAFSTDPPRIYAGGPFSDRGGASHNDFADFLPLDRYEAFAWRLKIEGSQGLAEREFNGPRRGWQEIYREGLARLDSRAGEYGSDGFAALPAPTQDLILRDSSDPAIAELVDVAFPHTLDTLYGAPEYGGNRELLGWAFTAYDGDVQPRGYTDEQVTQPDNPGLLDMLGRGDPQRPQAALLPLPAPEQLPRLHEAFARLIAMSSGELALGTLLQSEGRLSRLRDSMAPWLKGESR